MLNDCGDSLTQKNTADCSYLYTLWVELCDKSVCSNNEENVGNFSEQQRNLCHSLLLLHFLKDSKKKLNQKAKFLPCLYVYTYSQNKNEFGKSHNFVKVFYII